MVGGDGPASVGAPADPPLSTGPPLTANPHLAPISNGESSTLAGSRSAQSLDGAQEGFAEKANEVYQPTSPRYYSMRTPEEIKATRAASEKRRRTGEPFLEGFFEAGHPRAPKNEDGRPTEPGGSARALHPEAPSRSTLVARTNRAGSTGVDNQAPASIPVLHGLFDPSYFHDFQRRLREEVAASQELEAATTDSQDNGDPEGRPPGLITKMTSTPSGQGGAGAPGESMDVDSRPQPSSAHCSQASSGSNQQPPRAFSGEESQKTESEGEGEDVEGAGFESVHESSDEETSQDRAMIDDAPQEEENEVVQYGRMIAAMETDSDAEGFSQVLAKLKRRAPNVETNPAPSNRRRRVLLSPSDSSSEDEGSSSPVRSQAPSAKHPPLPEEGEALGADCPMPDDPLWEPEDDAWLYDLSPEDLAWSDYVADFVDLSLEDDFAQACEIVPHSRGGSSQATAAKGAPIALDAAEPSSLSNWLTSPSVPVPVPSAAAAQSAIGAAQQEQTLPAAAQSSGGATNATQPPPAPRLVPEGVAVQETMPFPQVPSLADVGGASRVDPIVAAAHHLHTHGVAALTFNMKVSLNDKGEEKKAPAGLMPEWQKKCDLGNCLRQGVRPGRACLAIVTEPSDLIVLDVDTKDEGVETFEEVLAEHGPLPDDTPWEWSGTRPGMHFFFSLSQSKAAGLLSGANRTKLTYKGQKVGLDTRGEGGMVFVGPSSYKSLDGTVRSYEWVQEIAQDRSNLRAMPGWLIGILNDSSAPSAAPGAAPLAPARFAEGLNADGVELPPPPAVLERIKKCLADVGDTSSRFDKLKRFPGGPDLYAYRVSGARVCPYGVSHSGSNNFCVLVRGRGLFYKCNSSECCDVHPQRKIGELTAQESMVWGARRPRLLRTT
ncbi:hypothetical protein KFL_001520080 [Klebsormidium nitens]|uniref:DNA primase/polymerase bifunctional N-terminal domain-containing protein n=1 Tax=Klebsormidium nitens TaxID=105231 RepID=A0A1Y1I602_KLENI|nr:hypothetical protein KFL_001520080 [Klebsormidium nitens]|eukprot:GAQ83538.1 hypothetical protein KFL_001520080 [Klebsormidium nitens]